MCWMRALPGCLCENLASKPSPVPRVACEASEQVWTKLGIVAALDGVRRFEWASDKGQELGDKETERRLLLTMPPDASGAVALGEVAELMAAVGALVALGG